MPIALKRSHVYAGTGLLVVAGAAYYFSSHLTIPDAKAGTKPSPTGNVIAVVNERPVYEFEIVPLVQNGVDRSIALDRRITQSVIASAAEKEYSKDAKIALDAARNDILAQIYATKRTEAIRASVTDKDISAFYDKNVTAEDARRLKVRSYVTADAREAQAMYETLVKDQPSKEVLSKLQYMKTDGDHYASVAEIPYGLGQTLKKMKAGEALQPVVVREGVLLVYLEDVKEVPKPELDKVKEEIRNILITQKMSEDIQKLRREARIELKS